MQHANAVFVGDEGEDGAIGRDFNAVHIPINMRREERFLFAVRLNADCQINTAILNRSVVSNFNPQRVQINDWINRNLASARGISYIKADGAIYVKDKTMAAAPAVNIPGSSLEWVPKFAERNNVYLERVYEQIIMGKITGVILVDRVFVIKDEPELFQFLKNYKHKK